MNVLMIGGTGIISTAVSKLLIDRGHSLHLLTRGVHDSGDIVGATMVHGDINDESFVKEFLDGRHYDVIVNWFAFTPEQIERDIRLFTGKSSQYIFISSASAYQRPPTSYLITENTPLENPFWQYSRNKIACEQRLMDEHHTRQFPVTIVRPSLTYGDTQIPYVLNSWQKPWTLIERIRAGKRIIVPGDGSSLWVITHNTDFANGFVGLMDQKRAIGEAFHITSDEVLTWDDVIRQIGVVIGETPNTVHISSEFIGAFMPDQLAGLIGDKTTSVVFDNSKIKSIVPDFKATLAFQDGIARTYAYIAQRPELQLIDSEYDQAIDRVIGAYDYGLSFSD